MDVFRNWITENKDELLEELNMAIFMEDWNKYAKGSLSAWEMEVMCTYYHDHELKDVNIYKYEVLEIEILNPKEVSKMIDNNFDLTLYTCTNDGLNRITVRCNRIIDLA